MCFQGRAGCKRCRRNRPNIRKNRTHDYICHSDTAAGSSGRNTVQTDRQDIRLRTAPPQHREDTCMTRPRGHTSHRFHTDKCCYSRSQNSPENITHHKFTMKRRAVIEWCTSGQESWQIRPVQPSVQSQDLESVLQTPPFRQLSHEYSQSGPNIPGAHTVKKLTRISTIFEHR